MKIHLFAAVVLAFSFYSCDEESSGTPNTQPVLTFGADQNIAELPVSELTRWQVQSETTSLSLLYAPDLSEDEVQEAEDSNSEDCEFSVDFASSTPEEVEFSMNVELANCPGLLEGLGSETDVSFLVQFKSAFYCEGADFTSVDGKSFSTSDEFDMDQTEFGCAAPTAKIGTKSRVKSNMRVSIKSENGGSPFVFVSEEELESSNRGDYCYREHEEGTYSLGLCRELAWSKSFSGDADKENNPYESESFSEQGAKYVLTDASLSGMTFKQGDLYYRGGDAKLNVNGWRGSYSYENELSSPLIELTRKDEVASFRLQFTRPGTELSLKASTTSHRASVEYNRTARKIRRIHYRLKQEFSK